MIDPPEVLDQGVLAELRESVGGDEQFVKELVAAYLAETPGYIAALATAASAGDPPAVVRPAHTVKSSSAAVGAMRLATISKDVEIAAREGRIDQAGVEAAGSVWAQTVAALTAAGLTK